MKEFFILEKAASETADQVNEISTSLKRREFSINARMLDTSDLRGRVVKAKSYNVLKRN